MSVAQFLAVSLKEAGRLNLFVLKASSIFLLEFWSRGNSESADNNVYLPKRTKNWASAIRVTNNGFRMKKDPKSCHPSGLEPTNLLTRGGFYV
jgi:hypothetical protein